MVLALPLYEPGKYSYPHVNSSSSMPFPTISSPKFNIPSTDTWSVLGSASKCSTVSSSSIVWAKDSSALTYEKTEQTGLRQQQRGAKKKKLY